MTEDIKSGSHACKTAQFPCCDGVQKEARRLPASIHETDCKTLLVAYCAFAKAYQDGTNVRRTFIKVTELNLNSATDQEIVYLARYSGALTFNLLKSNYTAFKKANEAPMLSCFPATWSPTTKNTGMLLKGAEGNAHLKEVLRSQLALISAAWKKTMGAQTDAANLMAVDIYEEIFTQPEKILLQLNAFTLFFDRYGRVLTKNMLLSKSQLAAYRCEMNYCKFPDAAPYIKMDSLTRINKCPPSMRAVSQISLTILHLKRLSGLRWFEKCHSEKRPFETLLTGYARRVSLATCGTLELMRTWQEEAGAK